jgi:hypothetical protein
MPWGLMLLIGLTLYGLAAGRRARPPKDTPTH